MCVRSSYQVPLGLKGTVIGKYFATCYFLKYLIHYKLLNLGISKSHNETEVVYTVIFDKEFPSGLPLGGSSNRGYKVCRMSFINLSYAIRNGLYKPLTIKKPANQTSNSVKQVCKFFYIIY